MSLRTVAEETPRLCRSTMPFEPTGSLVATKSATIARSTAMRRSSLFIVVGPPPTRLARTRLFIVGEARAPGRSCVFPGGGGSGGGGRARQGCGGQRRVGVLRLPSPDEPGACREQAFHAAHDDAGGLGGVPV